MSSAEKEGRHACDGDVSVEEGAHGSTPLHSATWHSPTSGRWCGHKGHVIEKDGWCVTVSATMREKVRDRKDEVAAEARSSKRMCVLMQLVRNIHVERQLSKCHTLVAITDSNCLVRASCINLPFQTEDKCE
ncbi:unnamed protein product [Sphenostylis stenocarpa]|uniref:Uncharacterized protein n=1 Tax=Sphenostylis stenocarpa TaxID=92480 RepID=A0AA86T4N7_9FABA|nr:unnamed protein product [Sphenostylis stenocarpa]